MSNKFDSKKISSYKEAGVDIEKADEFVESIKDLAKKTQSANVLGGVGGFAALYQIPLNQYREPVLVSSTDGVGTKLLLAQQLNRHETIGIDLVAMCVNDILCHGANPLFFLDYYATGRLNSSQAQAVLRGISAGCQQAGLALIGGETAEMPGMYQTDHYDLAGFCVGIIEKSQILPNQTIKRGDSLIALASSGPHSNGYSLIRRIVEQSQTSLDTSINNRSLADLLLEPTRIYVKTIQALLRRPSGIKGIAHITGGGIPGNLVRILPEYTQAKINQKSWEWPRIFHWLQTAGHVEEHDMMQTFNCGVGMIICIDQSMVDETLQQLKQLDETAWIIGEIDQYTEMQPRVVMG